MSLVCHECGRDVQPSDELPAREGGMIYPHVPSWIWSPDGMNWEPAIVPVVNQQVACCFECIIKGVQPQMQTALQLVFDAYTAEAAWRQLELKTNNTWFNGSDAIARQRFEAQDNVEAKSKLVPLDVCLCCGKGKIEAVPAHFTFVVMDRAFAMDKTSSWGSYQWSRIKTGGVGFHVCFSCAKTYLPRIFAQTSHSLTKTGVNTMGGDNAPELYISPEFKMWFEKHVTRH